MIRSLSFILLGLAAWAVIVAVSPSGGNAAGKREAAAVETTQPRERKSLRRETGRTAAEVPAGAEAGAGRREKAREEIEAAVITYSPGGVKAIRPWLLDADPEIRAAARDGMVLLGEADAVPLLRDAASKLEEPEEIAAFHEAADLLALPAWSETAEAQEVIQEIIEGNSR